MATLKNLEPKGQRIVKEITFQLTPHECKIKIREAGELDELRKQKLDESKRIAAEYKSQIDDLSAAISKILRAGKRGTEDREVEVTMTKDFAVNLVQFWFKDDKGNWEVVEERAMTEGERQMELDAIAEAPNKMAAAAKAKKVKDRKKAAAGDKDDEDEDTSAVIREETSRRTKRSAVDGVYS
jgi:hypothetical protein